MNIRNFCILAHIDHGKSTLADRLLEITKTVEKRRLQPQYLDRLESERERGITIKMAPVRMVYGDYILNLIDTPGHSDFSYEVSRALTAVEGAILLVDATQGIQAQTLANFEMARKANLKIIGAVTKTDLDSPNLNEVIKTLADLIGAKTEEILKISGKTGAGVDELLKRIVADTPPPKPSALSVNNLKGRALIFDSLYDEHKGIIAFVRVFDGQFKSHGEISFMATKIRIKSKEIGYFIPELYPNSSLNNGEIGYIATGVKDPDKIKIGDTIVIGDPISDGWALAGYKNPQPVVFVSFYPEDANEYDDLRQALAKLRLNDASLVFEPDKSDLLGRGFKGGFLGRLHFEITIERLEKEFHIATIQSFPSVAYEIKTKSGEFLINSPKDFPNDYLEAREPIALVGILVPNQYLGSILSLKRGYRFQDFITENVGDKVLVKAKLPLADLISDLDDRVKSLSHGYGSFSYQVVGYEKGELDKLEIIIAGFPVPGLTRILPKEKIEYEARATVEKLKDLLPRQQFVQSLQAAAGGRIVARENIPALKKDVTGYLYGGDRTRKMKLWKKQQRGKARLKERAIGEQVSIPPRVFKELLRK